MNQYVKDNQSHRKWENRIRQFREGKPKWLIITWKDSQPH